MYMYTQTNYQELLAMPKDLAREKDEIGSKRLKTFLQCKIHTKQNVPANKLSILSSNCV